MASVRQENFFGMLSAAAVVVALMAALPAGAAECAKVIVSGHPGYPPFAYYDGREMRGAWMAVASRVLSDLGVPYELSYQGPWTRVLQTAADGGIDLIAALKETPERASFLSFTATPAVHADIAVFVRNDSTFDFRGWQDLIGKTGGVVRDDRYGMSFDEFMQARLTVETVTTIDLDFKMLAAGRIDYVMTGYYPGLARIASLRLGPRLKPLLPLISQAVNGFAFVTSSPCARYLTAFDRQLAVRVADGTVQRLVDENLHQWQLEPLNLSD
jgi:polar amino acid transport system substrate-binding protein